MTGNIVSILLASWALYLLVRSLGLTKRILGVELPHEEFFIGFTCCLMFGFASYLSKILFPLAVLYGELTAQKVAVLLASGILVYGAFRFVLIQSGHRKMYLELSRGKRLEKKETYERVIGGLVTLAVITGLDGADLMLLLSMIVAFSSEMYFLGKILVRNVTEFSNFLKICIRGRRMEISRFVNRIVHDLKEVKRADIDESFWNSAFALIEYKNGLAFLLTSFTCAFPLLFVSWSIDIFNPKLEFLVGLGLLMVPSLISILVVRISPFTVKRDNIRLILFSMSLIVPVVTSAFVAFHPNLLPPLGNIQDINESNRLKVGAALLCSLLPVFTGISLFMIVVNAHFANCSKVVMWGKILGFSPFPLLLIMAMTSYYYAPVPIASYLAYILVGYLISAYFYMFIMYAIRGVLLDWEKKYRKDLSNCLSKMSTIGPNIETLIPSAAIGISAFILAFQCLKLHVVDITFSIFVPIMISFPVTFALECLSVGDLKKSIWVGLFAAMSYLFSYSLIMLSILNVDDFIRLFILVDLKATVVRLLAVLLGSFFASLSVNRFLGTRRRRARY